MRASIGVNLRVTGHSKIGQRKYMEDQFSVAYQSSEDEKNLEYAYFGVFDGHGGTEAANFAREHLMDTIVEQKLFWSENDEDILRSIRLGFIKTHYSMWRQQDKWPKTSSGFLSTAGTTASVAFIRRGKLYIGHVGDSGIILGYQEKDEDFWRAQPLTQDHKPESIAEKERIMNSGGKVLIKSGVPRVVWNRPRLGHKGPVRRSTPIDEIPFLAVARSLGDLWSYNSALNEFVVSPDPDVQVIKIDTQKFRCLIFGTDGLWNVLTPRHSVEYVRCAEEQNQNVNWEWTNPSKYLVDTALKRWNTTKMRADNISVVTIMLYKPGPPKQTILKQAASTSESYSNLYCLDYPIQYNNIDEQDDRNVTMYDHSIHETVPIHSDVIPSNGMAIMTRYDTTNIINDDDNNDKIIDNNDIITSTNSDINYMNTFAESYNSLLNSNYDNSLYNPQQTIQQQHFVDDLNLEINSDIEIPITETYSLTSLQTRNEQMSSFVPSILNGDGSSCSVNNSGEHHTTTTPLPNYPIDFGQNQNTLELQFNENQTFIPNNYHNNENEKNILYDDLEDELELDEEDDDNHNDNDNEGTDAEEHIDNKIHDESFDLNEQNINKLEIKFDEDEITNKNENENMFEFMDESIQINEISSSDSSFYSSDNSIIKKDIKTKQKTQIERKMLSRQRGMLPKFEPRITRSKDTAATTIKNQKLEKILRITKKNIKKNEKRFKAKIKLLNALKCYKKSTTKIIQKENSKLVNQKNNNKRIQSKRNTTKSSLAATPSSLSSSSIPSESIEEVLNKRTLRSKNILSNNIPNKNKSQQDEQQQRQNFNKNKKITVQILSDLRKSGTTTSLTTTTQLRQSCRLNKDIKINLNNNLGNETKRRSTTKVTTTNEQTNWINTIKKSSISTSSTATGSTFLDEISSTSSRITRKCQEINRNNAIIKTMSKRLTSRNSNIWCPGKTRQRVQKRLSH